MEDENFEMGRISEKTARLIAGNRTAMKILLLLKREKKEFNLAEIAERLYMDSQPIDNNLAELYERGFIEKIEDRVDSGTQYFRVSRNKKAVDWVIRMYMKDVAFKLALLLPSYNQRISADELKTDERFSEECESSGLTVSEGINVLLNSKFIEFNSVDGGKRMWLWRKQTKDTFHQNLRNSH